jgi:hypothetical protein
MIGRLGVRRAVGDDDGLAARGVRCYIVSITNETTKKCPDINQMELLPEL